MLTLHRLVLRPVLALLLGAGAGEAAVKRSLSTTFVEVLIEGVPVGSRYVLEAKKIEMINRSDLDLALRFEALDPQPSEMRAGYEPIPDPAWVGFEPRTHEVKVGQTATGKVVLYVPDDPALVGRRFQVALRLGTDPGAGAMLSVGVRPRLLFSVAPRDAKAAPLVQDAPRPLARLMPYETGTTVGFMTFECGKVTAENQWPEEMAYEVVPDPEAVKRVTVKPHETALPDPGWLETSPQALVLSRYSRGEFLVTARIPLSAEHFGRTYVGALHTRATRKGQKPVDTYNLMRVIVPSFSVTGAISGTVSR